MYTVTVLHEYLDTVLFAEGIFSVLYMMIILGKLKDELCLLFYRLRYSRYYLNTSV